MRRPGQSTRTSIAAFALLLCALLTGDCLFGGGGARALSAERDGRGPVAVAGGATSAERPVRPASPGSPSPASASPAPVSALPSPAPGPGSSTGHEEEHEQEHQPRRGGHATVTVRAPDLHPGDVSYGDVRTSMTSRPTAAVAAREAVPRRGSCELALLHQVFRC